MSTIWKWVKWVGAAIVAIGVLILIYSSMSGKSKQKDQIDAKIEELNAIEHRTEEQKQELADLQDQATAIAQDIEMANRKAAEALAALGKKKEEPGDAGKASDDLTNNW